jgi:cysteine desulfurase/selenocysteine lyase
MKTGWDNILRHERELVKYAVNELSEVKGLTLYISRDKYLTEDRIGTITFNLAGYHHALLTAILENEYGIETRAGTICNHRLVRRWLKVNDKEQKIIEEKIKKGDRLASYGIVRISLAIHNTKQDIDALVSALNKISKTGNELEYIAVPEEESFVLNK